MRPGLYEELLTRQIEQMLEATPQLDREISGVDVGEQPHVLARHVAHALMRRLQKERTPEGRIRGANEVLELLTLDGDTAIVDGPRQRLS